MGRVLVRRALLAPKSTPRSMDAKLVTLVDTLPTVVLVFLVLVDCTVIAQVLPVVKRVRAAMEQIIARVACGVRTINTRLVVQDVSPVRSILIPRRVIVNVRSVRQARSPTLLVRLDVRSARRAITRRVCLTARDALMVRSLPLSVPPVVLLAPVDSSPTRSARLALSVQRVNSQAMVNVLRARRMSTLMRERAPVRSVVQGSMPLIIPALPVLLGRSLRTLDLVVLVPWARTLWVLATQSA